MAPPRPTRTFSFDDNDEMSLHGTGRNGDSQDLQLFSPPAYADSPTRRYNDSPPPQPPTHRSPITVDTRQPQNSGYGAPGLGHSTSNRTASTITPGVDNMGEQAAGGGITGIALGIANANERESGAEVLKSLEPSDRGLPPERGFNNDTEFIRAPAGYRMSQSQDPFASPAPSRRSNPFEDDRRNSGPPSPGSLTPRGYVSDHNIPMSEYPPQDVYQNRHNASTDNPYKRFSTAWDPRVAQGDIDPNSIEDDGDDMTVPPLDPRRSRIGLKSPSDNSVPKGTATGLGGAASGGGVLGALGSLVGRNTAAPNSSRDASGQYGPVPGSSGPGFDDGEVEKSEWLHKQTTGRKRLRWLVGIFVLLALVAIVIGGVIGGLHAKSEKSGSGSSNSTSAAPDDDKSDLDATSPQIKKLMNNPNLHKVFPGMDYTPFNAQYPDCLTNPPSQNNVTMDVAVLSQLTNTVRLYGTDCNQTEMVLHAIDKLALHNFTVWLGVWLDNNGTTNDRGLAGMYNILSKYDSKSFAGVIVGNEVLYRKDMDETKLSGILSDVKKNFTSLKIDLPVATSDLGDDWTADLATDVDYVMSNIHPFFAGVTVDAAAGWTWDFWQQHDTILTKGAQKNVISETGWPSDGGTDCGEATTCSQGSVAGVSEMNKFMGDFVCQSLANGTNYFWFEAFDEPWKVKLNTPGKEWEDKWGLMDSGRKLKPGLTIPECGGKTID